MAEGMQITDLFGKERRTSHGLLPDPEPREVSYTVISVDDHIVEPRHMFEGRMPARFAEAGPRVVELDDGNEVWTFDGTTIYQLGLNAVVGRPKEDWTPAPDRFEDMRRGCYDIHERVRDMDIDGVWASLGFPSGITGFCGSVFSRARDPELGIAATQAWNDWMVEEWWSPYPERIIPLGITWLADPEVGAAEIRRNAERGVRALSMPEQPDRIGYPSLHSGYWDPILRACEETETVLCLHVGSTGMPPMADDGPRLELAATMFNLQSLYTCIDWLWAGIPIKFPDLKIAFSEGGIGWVPMLMDRVDYLVDRASLEQMPLWRSWDKRPSEVLRDNFWYCFLDDPTALRVLDRIGADHVMVEVDYPHSDSTWPDTQALLRNLIGHLPTDQVRKVTHENAARLFRHPLPEHPLPA